MTCRAETIRGQIYYQLFWRLKDDNPEHWRYVSRDGVLGAHPDSPQEIHEDCVNTMRGKKRKLEAKYPDRVYTLAKTQTISLTEIIE
jgi:hypothetical protein